jgi:anti-sigma regulatory factor (Ser/Thr protein kinase)
MISDKGPGQPRRGTVPDLDRPFDAGSLSALRAAAAAQATGAGMPAHRVADVVIAIHELAANAVRHGAGAGRLRIWTTREELHCQVEDHGPASSAGNPAREPGSRNLADRWPRDRGHGLWVVRQLTDHMTLRSGLDGTCAAIIFSLSRRPAGAW